MRVRYSGVHQVIHWLTALLMFSILPLAWVMTNAKVGSELQHSTYNWHKTLGLIVFGLTIARMIWRFVDQPPAYPPKVAAWDRALAQLAYGLFFAVMIWMPVTGFMDSAYDGYPIKLFNLIPTPEIFPKNNRLADFWAGLHGLGQWAVYGLIVLHLSAVVFHVVWAKDGVLGRMLPEGATTPEMR
ncbi:MAG TPA: cytochrome b [Caulobacteraceae bacterium]